MTAQSNFDTPIQNGWVSLESGTYVRPLVGYEAILHKYCHLVEQHGNWACGLAFTTQQSAADLVEAFTQALIQLRIFAPLVATDISEHSECGGEPCWVYKTLSTYEEAYRWAQGSLHLYNPAPSDDEFLVQVNQRIVPYEPIPGHKQYVSIHLLIRPGGKHSLYLHGSHAVLEGQSTLRMFYRMLESVSDMGVAAHHELGAEVMNLPPNVFHAMDASPAEPSEFDVPESLRVSQMSLGLLPQRDAAQLTGRAIIATRNVEVGTSREIFAQLDGLNLSVSYLCSAALVLAIVSMNRPLPQDAQVTLPVEPIALQRFLKPDYPRERYISSCLSNVPIVVPLREVLSHASPRNQVVAAMGLIKEQYQFWLARPDLLLAKVAGADAPSVKASPCSGAMSNFGRIEDYVPRTWPPESDTPVMEIHDVLCGFRIAQGVNGCNGHAWTIGDKLHLQVQARDVYDHAYLDVVVQRMDDAVRSLLEV